MKVRVRNIKGTSDENPPKGFESWIAYWEFKMKREIPNKGVGRAFESLRNHK